MSGAGKDRKSAQEHFQAGILTRMDEIIMFSALTPEQMLEIVDLQMNEVRSRLEERGLKVELTDEARTWLAKRGYDPSFGARPLKRALQKYVENPLSVTLLSGEYGGR